MNWPSVPIERVIVPTSVRDPRRGPAASFRYIDISSIDRHAKSIDTAPEIPSADAPSRARKAVLAGDILVSTVRPNLNTVALVPPALDDQIASTGFCVLRPNPKVILGKYLFYFSTTPEFADALSAKVRGAHYPAVSDADVKNVPILLPPLAEQRRIVEILDQADALRKKRAEADAKAARILPALFYEMFGDPATNPRGWKLKPLGELVVHLTSGSRGWSRYTGKGNALFLRTQDIKDGEIAPDLIPIAPPTGAEAERSRLQSGDVVVTITGNVGKAAAFRANTQDVYVSQHVALVRPDPRQLHPAFLTSYANLPLGEIPVLARFQYGQTKPGMGFRELTGSLVPVPPVTLQAKFAACLDALRAVRLSSSSTNMKVSNLWQALHMRAFLGDLTAEWREAAATSNFRLLT